MKGQIIGGDFANITVRQKSDENFEIGELFISESNNQKTLLQVTDLSFGSQISQTNLELISGMNLEDNTKPKFFDENIRLYNLAKLKSLAILGEHTKHSKVMPKFFGTIRDITKLDLEFSSNKYNMFLGNLRSGSKILDIPIKLNGYEILSHHVLIPATTGKGKSNLTSVLLWNLTKEDYCGILVLDPHDEYNLKMKGHPRKERISYYSQTAEVGDRTLKINLKKIKPIHFNGVTAWSDPQKEALSLAHRLYKDAWISKLLCANSFDVIHESTLAVVKRKLCNILDISMIENKIVCEGIF